MNENRANDFFNEEVSDYIDLMALGKALLRRWWFILLAGCVAGIAAYAFSVMTLVPTYKSSFTAYVNNSNQNLDSNIVTTSDIAASRQLTLTYAEIIHCRPVMELTVEKSGLEMETEELSGMISVGNLNDTELMKITITSEDPEQSYRLACALQDTAPEYVEKVLVGSSMQIVEPPLLPTAPSSRSFTSRMKKAFLAGAALACAVVLLIEFLDTRVKSTEMIESRYDVVVIGTIHDLSSSSSGYGYYGKKKRGNKK